MFRSSLHYSCRNSAVIVSRRNLASGSKQGGGENKNDNFWSYILKKPTKKKRPETSKRYSDTLCLPSTTFPLSMKGGVVADREVNIQKVCQPPPPASHHFSVV